MRFFFFTFTEAVNCLSKAIDIYTDMGRFTIAAKHHQTIAELYESDIADLERAMQHYEKSADYFRVCYFPHENIQIDLIILGFAGRRKQFFS